MGNLKVLIEARPFCVFETGPMERLKAEGMNLVDMRGSGMEKPDFVAALKDVDAVLAGNDLRVNDAMLDHAPRLKAVAKMGVGLDTVDVAAASERGVVVFHTPGVNNQAVADHTFALILAVARKIPFCDRSLREKRWEHTKIMGLEIWEKTIGLIGLGAIGRNVALRAKGFRMKVAAYDPFWPSEFAQQEGIERLEIDELLRVSDIVSIHTPLTPENRGMIDKSAFSRMKPGAILINTARGGIIDEKDLYTALKENRIAGAGIDVFEQEPPTDSPLLDLPNVVLSPHTAAFTREALNNMNVGIVEGLVEYAKGKMPRHTVNPEAFRAWKA